MIRPADRRYPARAFCYFCFDTHLEGNDTVFELNPRLTHRTTIAETKIIPLRDYSRSNKPNNDNFFSFINTIQTQL